MSSEPLNIYDKTFLISRLVQQAPRSTMIREFFKNAEENAALEPSGKGEVKIYPVTINGIRKLAFYNTGIGMDEADLRTATEISASLNKSMGLDGNFGIGAKVSGLAVSPFGIRYRSCKNGAVSQVEIGFDEEKKQYVRFAFELSGGQTDTVFDVTEAAMKEGKSVDIDWTEVVLMGVSEDHDTVAQPLTKGETVDRCFIPSEIFRRFASFLPGVKLLVDTAMTKGGGKEETGRYRSVKTLDTLLVNDLKSEVVRCDEKKLSIRYIHDPKHSGSGHSTSSTRVPAVASNTFCALVHKGERYDYKTRRPWSAAAPNFGIPFGSKVISIEILLDEKSASPNQYRDGLTNPENRSPILAQDFDFWVRDLMPDWVKKIIQDNSPKSHDNLEDLRSELQKLLDEFKIPTPALRQVNTKQSFKVKEADSGDATSKSDAVDLSEFPNGLELGNDQTEESSKTGHRADQDRVKRAPEGAKASRSLRALEQVPQIHILEDPAQIDEKMIKGKAASYYKDSQEIFVNGLYPAVNRMATELGNLLVGKGEAELVRSIALTASRRTIAFSVGKAVCFAISKRLVEEWSLSDLEKATTPEALSLPADDYRKTLQDAKRYALEKIQIHELESSTLKEKASLMLA